MKLKSTCLALILVIFSQISAKIWRVGASRTYKKPSSVSTMVSAGDSVFIDAGIYDGDVCGWSANNLYLKGVGGFAHLKANGTTFGGKAIWVISGSNARIDSVEFSLASCVDKNGAGIRLEGKGLHVFRCSFHDNEDGILCGADTSSDVLIEYSDFYNNGFGDGFSHNLYIGHIRTLTYQFNYSRHAKIGHELKSRANTNIILYNRFDDESDGTASRSIDLPNGGRAIIMGNEIIKGPQSQNSNFLEFGIEGMTNTGPQNIYIVHNTFVNKRSSSIFISLPTGVSLLKMYNNIFSGGGTFTFNSPSTLDSGQNTFGTLAAMKFSGSVNKEYELTSVSPAVNKGNNCGSAGSFSLVPVSEYNHPVSSFIRIMSGSPDAGAHEYVLSTNVSSLANEKLLVFPNPAKLSCSVPIIFPGKLIVYNDLGQTVFCLEVKISGSNFDLPVSGLPNGMYSVVLQGTSNCLKTVLMLNHE